MDAFYLVRLYPPTLKYISLFHYFRYEPPTNGKLPIKLHTGFCQRVPKEPVFDNLLDPTLA